MADPTVDGVSSYYAGSPDTQTEVENNVDNVEDRHHNGVLDSSLQIQQVLGDGPTLRGDHPNLVNRLAVRHNADGTHKIAPIAEGGTNLSGYTKGDLLYAPSTNVLTKLPIGAEHQPLIVDENGLPVWGRGLFFHGPSTVGSGSTVSHGGSAIIATNTNLGGVRLYQDFTLNSGVTVTIPAVNLVLVIWARDFIHLHGTISGVGAGFAGGTMGAGSHGTDQGAGGGGGGETQNGFAGGSGIVHGVYTKASGGSGGALGLPAGNGNNGSQSTGNNALLGLIDSWPLGGAGGGKGGEGTAGAGDPGGDGGPGGAAIVLIAPLIILESTCILNTSGSNGVTATEPASGGGGGGAAGNILAICRRFVNNGATFTQSGGTGGPGEGANGGDGGNGANGIRQILVWS